MNLKYGNVTLRAIELRDSEFLRRLINSPGIEHMAGGWNLPVSELAQDEWINSYRNSDRLIRWMIDLDNGVTIGMVMLKNIDWKNRCAEIGMKIDVNERARLKGDTKNAEYAVLKYAFDELGLHRIDGGILDYNVFSQKLNKSLGFVQEGVIRNCIFNNGEWHSKIVYGLLSEEFNRYPDGEAPWQRRTSREKD